jgi:hypothetical protein
VKKTRQTKDLAAHAGREPHRSENRVFSGRMEPLTSRSSWRGMWLVAHAWGTIAAAIALSRYGRIR